MELRRLASADEIARVAAGEVADAAREAQRARGRFGLALAGGDTPRRLYGQLATASAEGARSEPKASEGGPPQGWARVDWSRAELFFGDERAVGPEDAQSNYRMVRESLLAPAGIDARRVHRIFAERRDLDAAARDYEALLARVLGGEPGGPPPQLDLVLLGMGADGHTASLFPHSPALKEQERWVVPNEAPGLGRRITLTFPLILRARRLIVLVSGESKAAALALVLEGPRDSEHLPAQRLAQAKQALWLVDGAAASRLGETPRSTP
ncbi:MAG TPA: 6-phosphogluconolactonase [Myxococcota bacterium]|nr:6-phosphogluconolactonase [Myxococcota bacterium]